MNIINDGEFHLYTNAENETYNKWKEDNKKPYELIIEELKSKCNDLKKWCKQEGK